MRGDWRTIPNLLTILRLLSMPVFVWLLLSGHRRAAVILFALAMLSDLLDGLLARLLDQRTHLGAVLDPIADKAVLLTALVGLGLERRVPWWLIGLVLLRDAAIGVGALVVRARRLEIPGAPSRVGKYATFALTCLIVLALASLTTSSELLVAYTAVVGLIAGLCVAISTVQYLARFGPLLWTGRRPSASDESPSPR